MGSSVRRDLRQVRAVALDPEDLPLVPVFGRMMQETGIKGKLDPTQLQRQLGAKTGGVGGSVLCTLKVPEDGTVAQPDDIVYRYISRGLYEKDRLSFKLLVLFNILVTAGRLTPSEVTYCWSCSRLVHPHGSRCDCKHLKK